MGGKGEGAGNGRRPGQAGTVVPVPGLVPPPPPPHPPRAPHLVPVPGWWRPPSPHPAAGAAPGACAGPRCRSGRHCLRAGSAQGSRQAASAGHRAAARRHQHSTAAAAQRSTQQRTAQLWDQHSTAPLKFHKKVDSPPPPAAYERPAPEVMRCAPSSSNTAQRALPFIFRQPTDCRGRTATHAHARRFGGGAVRRGLGCGTGMHACDAAIDAVSQPPSQPPSPRRTCRLRPHKPQQMLTWRERREARATWPPSSRKASSGLVASLQAANASRLRGAVVPGAAGGRQRSTRPAATSYTQ